MPREEEVAPPKEKKSHRQGRRGPTAKGEEAPTPREKKFGHARAQAFVDAFLEQEIIR